MGKRRDRRQQQASNRRVKLDLSTDDALSPSEPPGPSEVLGSTLGEEVKAGAKNQEAANDNPLSLLGQYSDDEADEDDGDGAGFTNNTDNETPTNIGNETGEDIIENQDEQENAAAILATGQLLDEKETTSSPVLDDQKHDPTSFRVSETDLQRIATTDNEWQAVLHEESGEYYYWNVKTGETTWVMPVSLENKETESSANQPVDLETPSVISSELPQKQIHANGDQGESDLPESDRCLLQIKATQDTERESAIACPESSAHLEPEIDDASMQIKSALDGGGETAIVTEKCPDLEDQEPVGSEVFAEGQNKKETQGEETEEKPLTVIEHDDEGIKPEALETIGGGVSDRSLQPEKSVEEDIIRQHESKFFLAGLSLSEAEMGDRTATDSPLGTTHTYVHRITEETKVSLAERGDALQQRLNILARDSLGLVPRLAQMALQAEARVTDWKAFCALGFNPEACFSFIQNELEQLESILLAEEAIELDRQKAVQPTSTGLDSSQEIGPLGSNVDWSLSWGYYQQKGSLLPEPWKHSQSAGFSGNAEDVEEGEIPTSYGDDHAAYSSIHEGLTMANNPNLSNLAGGEDVDMDVDMEVDDGEVEAEPAVPGMSSGVPSYDTPLSYLYPCSLLGSNDVGTAAPLDSSLVGDPTHYYPVGPSGEAWAPPLPPDDEWAPPPPGETEPAPPPPPDEPPPLPSRSPQLVEAGGVSSVAAEMQVHYLAPEYALGTNPLPQYMCAPEYHPVLDASGYAYVEDVPGVVYSNSPQLAEALKVEQPYVVASVSRPAVNGWSAPALATTASSLANPVQTSEAPVKSTSYVHSIPTASSMAADSTTGAAISEGKKTLKGKVRKRTHAVAAAPMLNKKVSSLVDKWKQAKEELHGGEDDEEDKALYDVEVLEKKRQKEIEEWRRQQIASGDALDNANFQPLGTIDWRERVKRAKRADSKERTEGDTGSEAPPSTAGGQSRGALKLQKPNMSDLSKGLPAGWQAYWDEASGEVYYGNLITQETTWDRPVT